MLGWRVLGGKFFRPMRGGDCDGCSNPIQWWERRVWLDRQHRVHRGCWRGQRFFKLFIASQSIEELEVSQSKDAPSSDYEVGIDDLDNGGLIVVWDFGWASLQDDHLRAVTELARHHDWPTRSHQVAGVSIAMTDGVRPLYESAHNSAVT